MMKVWKVLTISVVILIFQLGSSVGALAPKIVIAQVQTGGAGPGNAAMEFVALHNNEVFDVDVTDWCISYSDYNDSNSADLFCFIKSPDADQVRIPAQGSVLVASQSLVLPINHTITSRYINPTTVMSGIRGHVYLNDSLKFAIDRVAWDNRSSTPPKNPESIAAPAPSGGSMISRILLDGIYIDTDDNSADFLVATSAPLAASALIDYSEPEPVIDLCGTLDGVQEVMPDGYGYDEAGNCELLINDVCPDINLIQLVVPTGYEKLISGECVQIIDVCPNIDSDQAEIPDGYELDDINQCIPKVTSGFIRINELFPNAAGSDLGKEFIEIYNADVKVINLADYTLRIGKNAEKIIQLPETNLLPGEFIVFKDTDLAFTLLNSTTRVELWFRDSQKISDVIPYQDPGDDMSWILRAEGGWVYSNRPTPGLPNLGSASVLSEEDKDNSLSSTTDPCPAGKYRNPLTNRCRNIEEDATVIASCDNDEYRNPETNRCRKIILAAATLAPCQPGYERNSETNRCRKLEEETSLQPCDEGYERNPITNRCKKSVSIPSSVQSPKEPGDSVSNFPIASQYSVAALVGIGAVTYGVYEWRSELRLGIRRFMSLFSKK